MKIAVIGTGNIGAAYAHAFAQAGLNVVIGHREPATAAALAKQVGGGTEGTGSASAIGGADVVLLALPYAAIAGVLAEAGIWPAKC